MSLFFVHMRVEKIVLKIAMMMMTSTQYLGNIKFFQKCHFSLSFKVQEKMTFLGGNLLDWFFKIRDSTRNCVKLELVYDYIPDM